jgi:hypothetical protein
MLAFDSISILIFNKFLLNYTYLESARRELSNDAHIDHVCVYTQNFRKNMDKNRLNINILKHSKYGYRLKALDELISNMYILRGIR